MQQLGRAMMVLCVLLVSLVALAGVVTLPAGLAVVTVPEDWSVGTADGHLQAVSRDAVVTLLLRDSRPVPVEPPLPRPFAGVAEFEPEGRPESLKFNGFTGFIQRGKGKVDDKPVAAEQIQLTHRLRKFAVTGWIYADEKKYTRERRDRARRIVRTLRSVH